VTFKPSFLADHGATLTNVQLGQLWRLMHYLTTKRQMLPIDRDACAAIAHATTRDDHRFLDRLLAEHFTITDLGRVPATLSLRLTSQARLYPATDGEERVTLERHATSVTRLPHGRAKARDTQRGPQASAKTLQGGHRSPQGRGPRTWPFPS
jgi:hypothetical protein